EDPEQTGGDREHRNHSFKHPDVSSEAHENATNVPTLKLLNSLGMDGKPYRDFANSVAKSRVWSRAGVFTETSNKLRRRYEGRRQYEICELPWRDNIRNCGRCGSGWSIRNRRRGSRRIGDRRVSYSAVGSPERLGRKREIQIL